MDNTVSAAPIVALLQPYVNLLVSALVTALVGLVLGYVNKFFGLNVDQKNRDALAAAATTAAGKVLAGVEGNLAEKSFTVGNSAVREAIAWVEKSAPDAIARFGLGPEDLEKIILGKIGQLQASATATPVGK